MAKDNLDSLKQSLKELSDNGMKLQEYFLQIVDKKLECLQLIIDKSLYDSLDLDFELLLNEIVSDLFMCAVQTDSKTLN